MSVANTYNSHLERVSPELQSIFAERSGALSKRIKAATGATTVSRYLYRIALKNYNGGNFAKYNANGGSLGIGTAQKQANLFGGYFRTVLGYRLTDEQIDTSSNSEQAIVDVLADTIANAMDEAAALDDITLHQTGTGILTNSSSAITNTTNATMTFASATDTLGIIMLREGMCISVWDSTGATERAAATAAPIIITNIDYDSKTITLNQEVTTLTQGDLVSFRGMAAYGPSTLTSFASTYPGTAPITGNGIGGDSFRHGIPYWTDPTSSNYFYGQQKSTMGQLMPLRVNANSTTMEWEFVHRLIAKAQQKRNGDPWKENIGVAHFTQRTALMNLGVNITTNMMQGGDFGRSLDMVPSNVGESDVFNMAGIPCYTSRHQDRGRIDLINLKKIERVQLFDTQFYKRPGSSDYMFEGRGSDGTVQSFREFFIVQAYDYICRDSGTFGRIDGLLPPSNSWDA